MKRLLVLIPLLILTTAALMPLQAQQDTETASAECVALVETAMTSFAENCAALGGGAACVGSESVNAGFTGDAVDFAAAGDTADLSALQSVTTSGADAEAGQWGLARLNVFANVPQRLSPTGLIYLLIGDVAVTNAVTPDSAFVPGEPVGVTVLVGANLRSAPNTDSTVLASAPVGTQLFVDGVSSDGAFFRAVTEDNQVVWISSQVVAPDEGSDLSSLPTLNSSSRTLMQSIFLQTGAESNCGNAPTAFIAQSPGGFLSAITVNGADIRFDGTIALFVGEGGVMRLIVVEGSAFAGGVSIPAGFTVDVQLNAEGTGLDGVWSNLRPINDAERAALTPVDDIPQDVLFETVEVPSQEEVLNTLAALNGASSVGAATGSGALNCARFRPTSPLGGMPNGNATFFWDGVQGATSYRLNLYNEGGSRVTSLETGSTNTTLSVNTTPAAIGGGSNFSWDVEALLNGQSACTTARASVVRDATSQFVSGGGGDDTQITPTVCTWQGCS